MVSLLGKVLLEAVVYCSAALISTLYWPLANGGGFVDSQRCQFSNSRNELADQQISAFDPVKAWRFL
jgi:hypothetical protein